MKKLVLLSCALVVLASCKKNEEKTAPDPVMETPADTIKKDTLAYNHAAIKGELLAMNSAKANEINALFPKVLNSDQEVEYVSFGKKITADKALTNAAMLKKYKGMKTGDTINVKFKSTVTSVCKKKGCWMKVTLPEGKESFVRFKDYEYFVPLNADNSTAVMSGKAYLDVISVAELKHYAKDGGKSQEEINKIKEPKITYAFMADGVLLAQ